MTREVKFKELIAHPYHSRFRRAYLQPFLKHLDKEGKLGVVIANLGSAGRYEQSAEHEGKLIERSYVPSEGKKVINFDLGFDKPFERVSDGVVNIQGDLNGSLDSFATRRRLVFAKRFLGGKVKADTVVMADVLNYVDFRKVIRNAHALLNKNGRVVIANSRDVGFGDLFHVNAPRSNQAIVNELKSAGFEVEHSAYETTNPSEYPNYSSRPPSVGALIVARKI